MEWVIVALLGAIFILLWAGINMLSKNMHGNALLIAERSEFQFNHPMSELLGRMDEHFDSLITEMKDLNFKFQESDRQSFHEKLRDIERSVHNTEEWQKEVSQGMYAHSAADDILETLGRVENTLDSIDTTLDKRFGFDDSEHPLG